jgi:hypothetical protein
MPLSKLPAAYCTFFTWIEFYFVVILMFESLVEVMDKYCLHYILKNLIRTIVQFSRSFYVQGSALQVKKS